MRFNSGDWVAFQRLKSRQKHGKKEESCSWHLGIFQSMGVGLFAGRNSARVSQLVIPETFVPRLSKQLSEEECRCDDPLLFPWPSILVLLERFRLIDFHRTMKLRETRKGIFGNTRIIEDAQKYLGVLERYEETDVEESTLKKIAGYGDFFRILTKSS